MALLLMESFDHEAATIDSLMTKWTQTYINPSNVLTISASAGRRSTNGLRATPTFGGNSEPLAVTLPQASGNKAIVSLAFRQSVAGFVNLWVNNVMDPTMFSSSQPSNGLMYVRQGGANQVSVRVNLDGTLSVLRGTNPATVIAGPSSRALTQEAFAYIELEVVLATGATGSVNLYVNGALWIAASSVQTAATGVATWNEVVINHASNPASPVIWDMDDVVIADGNTVNADGTTSTWTAAKQRDIMVDVLYPIADGAHSDFTPSTGTVHYQMVDEQQANGDTDTNRTTTINAIDTLAFADVPVAGAEIYGIQVVTQARKLDAGAVGHRAVARVGGVDRLGIERGLSSSYTFLRECWDAQPVVGGAWTDTIINASEFGYKKST